MPLNLPPYFEPRAMTEVITRRKPLPAFFRDRFFRRRPPQNASVLEVHVVSRGRQLAPFVTEHEAGRIVGGRTKEAYTIKAPRLRPKRPFRAVDLLNDMAAGRSPYDEQTDPVELALVETMDDLRDDIELTVEWMCAQAVTGGKVLVVDNIEGVQMPVFTVDYQMPAAHRVLLDGADLWSAAGSKLRSGVEGWANLIQEETGLAPDTLALGKNAWDAFFGHADVKDSLDTRNVNGGTITLNANSMFKGVWNGLEVFVYSATCPDHTGEVKHLLDPDCALLGCSVNTPADTRIEYGRPVDLACKGPAQVFAKAWEQDDPSGLFVLAESRPLPWPRQPGAFVHAKVL